MAALAIVMLPVANEVDDAGGVEVVVEAGNQVVVTGMVVVVVLVLDGAAGVPIRAATGESPPKLVGDPTTPKPADLQTIVLDFLNRLAISVLRNPVRPEDLSIDT